MTAIGGILNKKAAVVAAFVGTRYYLYQFGRSPMKSHYITEIKNDMKELVD